MSFLISSSLWLIAACSWANYASASSLWTDTSQTFIRVHASSSIVIGNDLYIDGGEVYTLVPVPIIIASTLKISLASSWTSRNVQAKYVDKPTQQYPFARGQSIWTDGSNLYTAGGIRFYFPGCIDSCRDPFRLSEQNEVVDSQPSGPEKYQVTQQLKPHLQHVPSGIWKLPLDTFDKWTKAESQPPSTISELQGAMGAQVGDKYYAFGGASGWPFKSDVTNPLLAPVPGIASWDADLDNWKNDTSIAGFKPHGFAAFGQAILAPFGKQGIIVYIGGYAPRSRPFPFQSTNAPYMDMSTINIYDIASGNFISQTASGDIPLSRWSFCAVGASESNTGTFDIFIFGGDADALRQETPRSSLQYVYILSLPSFTWTKVVSSKEDERATHTCQVIGNRQMVMIGGMDPSSYYILKDNWLNGIQLFDMSLWKWKAHYDAQAAPYQRHQDLVTQDQEQGCPEKWDSPAAQEIFQNSTSSCAAKQSKNAGNSSKSGKSGKSSKSGSSDTGAIAGGVVGGVVGLALIIGAFFFWRWRRNRSNPQDNEKGAHEDYMRNRSEAPNSEKPVELTAEKKPVELGPEQAWELENTEEDSMSASDDTRLGSDPSRSASVVRHELEG